MHHFKINNNQYQVITPFLFMIGVLTACNAGMQTYPTEIDAAANPLPLEAVVKPAPTQTGIAPLTEEILKNATYLGIYQESVQLINGTYTGTPSVEGAASKPTLRFTSPYAIGDISGDGVEDAAVILEENSGGSGSFIYLAAVLNQQGKPANVATLLLGDRVQIQSVTIAEDQIMIKLRKQGPNDPMCCPTQEVENTYELQENELVVTNSKILR